MGQVFVGLDKSAWTEVCVSVIIIYFLSKLWCVDHKGF